ncbi:hypothetical protein M5G07_09025 [Serratia symbiotica]|nr:hypothetical protein [Serratia symbiotica]
MQFNFAIQLSLLLVFYPLFFLWFIPRWAVAVLAWPRNLPLRVLLWVYLLPLGIIAYWFSFHVGCRLTEWLQSFLILAPALLVDFVH